MRKSLRAAFLIMFLVMGVVAFGDEERGADPRHDR